jgi:hypothetical protein
MILNQRGFRSGEGNVFHRLMVHNLRHIYGLKSRYDRCARLDCSRSTEIAEALDICTKVQAHGEVDVLEGVLAEVLGDLPGDDLDGRSFPAPDQRRLPERDLRRLAPRDSNGLESTSPGSFIKAPQQSMCSDQTSEHPMQFRRDGELPDERDTRPG